MGLQYLRAGDNVLYGATVSTPTGATDASHTDDWLTDGRNRPARATSGTVTWLAVAPAAGEIGVAVVHSHTIDAARTVTIAGDVSGSGVGLAARTNGIPVDIWIPIAVPVTDTDVSVGIASNSVAVIIAELLAGKLRELGTGFDSDSTDIGYLDIGTVKRQSVGGSVPNFGRGLVARYISGSFIVDTADRDALMDWYESTRENVRPSAIKPFEDRNEAWVVSFGAPPSFRALGGGYTASLLFHEWPRKRWL